jgi:DNA repair exonuclease SbcCD nuclease subunit
MSSFDLISDIHLDFWVPSSWNILTRKKTLDDFIQKILPDRPSAILAIAGDIGHFNKQNYTLLKALKMHYKYILLVAGNHDYYLQSKSIRYKYAYNSLNRLIEMKKLIRDLPNVFYLDGDVVTIDGIHYGGCGMWYDFQYGIQVLNSNYPRIYEHWRVVSNDAILTRGKPRLTKDMFYEEKRKLARILPHSDVIITHFSPDWSQAPEDRKLNMSTSFYYFDGAPFFPLISKKIWCFGHIHRRMDYDKYGCRFVNAALGYPTENNRQPKRAVQVKISQKHKE